MDPASAVGLASSIITFVEFAWNLVGGAVKIYRSVDGTLNENARLDDVTDDLDFLSDLLAREPVCWTRAERNIARVAKDCRADSKALQHLLTDIAGPRNNRAFWRSLRMSWMNVRSRKDVVELTNRLQVYRSEVLLHVTLLLGEEQSALNIGIAKIKDECCQLNIGFKTEITSMQKAIIAAIKALNQSTGELQASVDTSFLNVSKLLVKIQAEVDETQLQHRILSHLVFEDMNTRADQIPEAAGDTYNWMVEDRPANEYDQRRLERQLFLGWLRLGDKILHISGKPGSGKSTLMKFLSQHERTKQELHAWASPNKLIFCVFYFWNSGSKLQRTQKGLYRSVLFQALGQCPELTEEVFPVQFRAMKTSIGDKMVEKIHYFDDASIEQGFKLLLNRASTGGFRMCFFIDGLDECEGNRLQHEDLANMLQTWVAPVTFKMCVSARPYSEFIRPLNILGNRLIHLHELNESDIESYCLRRLGNDIDARKRGDLCRHLGVFLWVHLVIDVLLAGFRQDDPDSVLKAQLNALPSDLDRLYTKLREPIEADSIQRARSNRLLLLAARNPGKSDLTAMACSWLEGQECDKGGLMSPDFPPTAGMKPYSEEEIEKRLDHVTKQINGLARGFLEIRDVGWNKFSGNCETTVSFYASVVKFCHRTARDYLLENEDRHRVLLQSFPNFDQSQAYAKICLAESFYGWDSLPERHDVFDNLDWPSRNSIDPELIARYEHPLRESLTPATVRLFPTSTWISTGASPVNESQVSFLAYAVYCGLDHFVLRQLARDATRPTGISASGSILLAAVMRPYDEFTAEFLSMAQDMNELCVVFDEKTNEQSLVPACVIATAWTFQALLGWVDVEDISNRLERIEKLLDSSLGLNISICASLKGLHDSDATPTSDSTETRFRINIVDAVELFKTPAGGIESYTAEASHLWAANKAKKISQSRDWQVDGNGTDVVRWLEEWLWQRFDSSEEEYRWNSKRLELVEIEWASDSQEMVRISGRTRLY